MESTGFVQEQEAMKIECSDKFARIATSGLQWGQFTCPGCQFGKFLHDGLFRKIYTVDQKSSDQYRRHLLINHAVNHHEDRVKIVEFLRRSAMETGQYKRVCASDHFANKYPFYSCCVLCDKTRNHETIFATSHAAILHFVNGHFICNFKSLMIMFNASRGYWSCLRVLFEKVRKNSLEATLLPNGQELFECPFCQDDFVGKFTISTLEPHLFAKHCVRNFKVVDFLKQYIVQRRGSILDGAVGNKKWPFDGDMEEMGDEALFWHIPNLPQTLSKMPSHRFLCIQFLANLHLKKLSSSTSTYCFACPQQKQPPLDQSQPLASLFKHFDVEHSIESAFHILFSPMQKKFTLKELHLPYFIIGHHVIDFQTFSNPLKCEAFVRKLTMGVPNQTCFCPFCCVFGITTPIPTPKQSVSEMKAHLINEHAFRNRRFARELSQLFFGKTIHIDSPIELNI